MEWSTVTVIVAVLLGGVSLGRNIIWARVHIRELEQEGARETVYVHDAISLLRRDVDELMLEAAVADLH